MTDEGCSAPRWSRPWTSPRPLHHLQETGGCLAGYLLLLLLLASCSGGGAVPVQENGEPAAVRTSLASTWKFRADPEDTGTAEEWFRPDLDQSGWIDHEIPGNWNFLFRGERIPDSPGDYDGPAWYRTRFLSPPEMEGRLIKLHFGGVCYRTRVWLNGEWVGEHEGDYLPFSFDITGRLTPGRENLLAMRVETINADSVNTIPPEVGRYDYWIYSGIKREVYLENTADTNLFDLFVYGEPLEGGRAAVRVETWVLNSAAEDREVEVSVYLSSEGSGPGPPRAQRTLHVPARTKVPCVFELELAGAALWSPEHPNLYRCRAVLNRADLPAAPPETPAPPGLRPYAPGGKIPPHARLGRPAGVGLDAVEARFGIRKIETQGRRILLNGEPVVFKGINRHDEYPLLGDVMPEEIYREDLRLMKQAGMNALRTAHYPNDPRIYDLADELGFLVIEEIPATSLFLNEMNNVPEIQDLALDYARRMVLRDRNHPSIVIWSAVNEPLLWGSSSFNSRLYGAMKALDPTRLVSYARVLYDIICEDPDSDLILLNPYWGWYVGDVLDTDWFLDLVAAVFPEKPIVVSEFGADAQKGNRTLADPRTSVHWSEDYQVYHLAATWEIIRAKEYTAGGFIWVFADFLSPTRKYLRSMQFPPNRVPNPVPYHNLKGIVDSYRVPKNSYLTVLGMYRDLPLHHLTVRVLDAGGEPVGAQGSGSTWRTATSRRTRRPMTRERPSFGISPNLRTP